MISEKQIRVNQTAVAMRCWKKYSTELLKRAKNYERAAKSCLTKAAQLREIANWRPDEQIN